MQPYFNPTLTRITNYTRRQKQLLLLLHHFIVRNRYTILNYPLPVPVHNLSSFGVIIPSITIVVNTSVYVDFFLVGVPVHFVVEALVFVIIRADGVVRAGGVGGELNRRRWVGWVGWVGSLRKYD